MEPLSEEQLNKLPPSQKVLEVVRLRKNRQRRDEIAERWWEVAAQNLDAFPEQVRRFIGDASIQECVVQQATAEKALKACEAVCRGFTLDISDGVEVDFSACIAVPNSACITFEVETVLQTSLLFTDQRVSMWGHASSRIACVASSAAVQTFARCAATLGVLAAPIEMDPTEPRYDVQLVEGEISRALIAGVWSTLRGIAQECRGQFVVTDSRKLSGLSDEAKSAIERIADQARETEAAGYAATMPDPARAVIRDVEGRPLRTTA